MLHLSFTPYPILETERLVLRKPMVTDHIETFRLRSDDEHNKYVDRPKANTIEDAQNFLRKLIDGIDSNEWISWAITRKGATTLLGSVGLWNIAKENATAEIGFELNPHYQGKGIMTEAVSKAIAYGFDSMLLNKIEGWVHKDNQRSIKLLEHLGFIRDETAEAQHAGKGYFTHMLIYVLNRKL